MIGIHKGFAAFCLALTPVLYIADGGTSCKNDNNADVTWFFMYKFPNGGEYVYVDSNTPSSEAHWKLSRKKIFQSGGALANTIAPLTAAKKPKDLTYIVYNDQVEEEKTSQGGHTKGLFMFDNGTGVWLIHSVPNFPQRLHKSVYVYPTSGQRNGQIALCVTFPSTQLETIAKHLRLQHPNIYDSFVPASEWEGKMYPHLNLLSQRKFNAEAPWVMNDMLKDVANNGYISFAKHGKFNEDVYSGLVAPTLKTSLLVSTWRNGNVVKVQPHLNGALKVENVKMLNFTLDTTVFVGVSNTVDHSKWAISTNSDKFFVCVGTINRVFSQYRRGGETLCFQNDLLHKLLRRSVTDFEGVARKRQRA